jgi:hypothetical protein
MTPMRASIVGPPLSAANSSAWGSGLPLRPMLNLVRQACNVAARIAERH